MKLISKIPMRVNNIKQSYSKVCLKMTSLPRIILGKRLVLEDTAEGINTLLAFLKKYLSTPSIG